MAYHRKHSVSKSKTFNQKSTSTQAITHMDIRTNSIDDALIAAIKEAHAKAEETTLSARNNMQRAINNRIMCAGLVEKAKQMHKQDLAGFLSDAGISGKQVKAYLSLHDAASKRPALHDKRQLQLCGILEAAERPDQPKREPMKQSVISTASSFIGRFNKTLDRRPLEEWETTEREQVKDVLKPVIEFYNSL